MFTSNQILDSFSETLLQDERILSARERALLTTLLQHAETAAGENCDVRAGVRAAIASAVGETVAQRAFSVLGESIVARILQHGMDTGGAKRPIPRNFGTEPGPPGVSPAPQESPMRPSVEPVPSIPTPAPPSVEPGPPRATPIRPMVEPAPPRATTTKVVAQTAVQEPAEVLPARCVVLEEFLAPAELASLTGFVLERETEFRMSEVIVPNSDSGAIDYEHRRSRVLMNLGKYEDLLVARIKTVLPEVLPRLGMQEFEIAGIEAQVTASNDGDFFHCHRDSSSERVRFRYLTFVYFFHREPKQFEGGELRIHDGRFDGQGNVNDRTYQTIIARQNQLVLFSSELLHEITPVRCPSRLFADSRFTLNGWLRR